MLPAASAEVKDAFVSGIGFIRSSFESPEGYEQIGQEYAQPAQPAVLPGHPAGRLPDHRGADQLGGARRPDPGILPYYSRKAARPGPRQRAQPQRAASSQAFPEDQIYRIDHYLGKETVQNIMLMRFGNRIFEPVWNNRYVDHVQITMAETIGVGTRGRYYESAGALRDMMQNHMLQLLSLVAMEPPVDLDPDSIHDEKVKVLKSIAPITAGRVATETVRGQYEKGIVEGAEAPGYREEDGVDRGLRAPRHSRRSACSWIPGAGRASRSSCGPASACRGGRPRFPCTSSGRRSSSSRRRSRPPRPRTS